MNRALVKTIVLAVLVTLVTSCGPAAPAATDVPVVATLTPPPATATPTATVPATATAQPAAETPAPPSAGDGVVQGWAVLAEKDDYTDVDMTNLPVGYIGITQMRGVLEQAGWDNAHIREEREFDRASLVSGLDWLEKNADQDDVVVLYVAAHGMYLQRVLSWQTFFADEWEDVPSHRRVLLIDSCQAANYTAVTLDDPAPFLAIAAVGKDEYGWSGLEEEGLPIIGGVFTHYFAAAFEDRTADADGDGYVSIQEAAYVAEKQQRTYMHEVVLVVPEFVEGYHKIGSYPETDPDFPHVIVNDTVGEPLYLALDAYRSAATGPASGSSAGLIAFVSTRDGNGEIYVMDTDGSNQRRLTNYPQWDGYPDWSPDGTQIVYYSYVSDKNWVIKVVDTDGGNPHQLTGGDACDGAPHWSPDGTRIAYTSAADCVPTHRDVYVIDADGSNPLNLTQHPADDIGSSWSPDSSQIAFSSNRDGNYELYVMDADGSNVHRLTENSADDYAPAWSPDGTQIAFYSNRDGDDEVYVMDADGGNPRNLTDNPTEDWFPRWSPDGKRITFSSRRGGNLDIYVMNADGSGAKRLTDSPGEDFNSVWQHRPASGQSDTWIRSYQGVTMGTVHDGVATADGGYLFVGSTNYTHNNRDDEDIYLLKTDAAGEPLWEKTLGGERFDRGNRILPAAGGRFLVFGETRSLGAGERDLYLLQIDEEGGVLWEQTYGGPAEEQGQTIRLLADGGTILAGQTASFGAGGTDIYLVRTDAQGDALWTQTYGSELDEEGYAAVELPDRGFLVLGVLVHEGRDFLAMNPDVYLVRTDESGKPLWSRVWEEAGAQSGFGLLPTADGHYLVYGLRTDAGGGEGMDALFLKIDADGNVLWNQDLSQVDALEYACGAVETADGGYLLTGMAMSGSSGGIPWVRLDRGGQLLWQEMLSEERGARAGLRILEVPAGGYLVIATVSDGGRGWYTLLIKTDTEGNVGE